MAVTVAAVAAGCSGGSDDKPEAAPPGKVEIKEMPPGTQAPGDSRPSQSDESRDSS